MSTDRLLQLREIFAAPALQDEEATRLARLTHFILLTILVAAAVYTIAALFLATDRLHRLPIVLIFPVFSLSHLIMLRRGNVRLTGISLTAFLWLIITGAVFTGGGIQNPGYGANVVIVGIAALLLGGRWALGFAGLSALAGLIMIWAENADYIEGQGDFASLSVWLIQTAYFIVAAVLIHLAAQNIYRALERVRANEQLLRERNELLITEITGREEAEQRNLQLALERERLEAFRQLISEISHDLKTPLATINTSLYLLERLEDPQKQQEKIETIKKQTEYLKTFVQDILTISRLEHLAELDLRPTDANEILSELEGQIRSACEEKSLELTFDLNASQTQIRADKDEIRRVVLNLLENAVNYTPQEGAISVRTQNEEGDFVMEIADTGIGIAESDFPHIFDRFYRAENVRTTDKPGTGLGLAIVKKIVEIHQGQVVAASRLGSGTIFRVRLPLINAHRASPGF